mmetsp:Transcript_7861/g.22408  ORF Transcript_7861/g.22408 Transcript_7861/m.22408 type:complete len:149 (-) Transcript_7861:130-576(-)
MVSQEMLIYSYVFTFAALMAIMTNVCQYFYFHPGAHIEGSVHRLTPFWLLVLATVLLLLSPLKNLVVNICMASFKANGYDATIGSVLDVAYKPCFGTAPMQAYTCLGYALMTVATGMQVDVVGKFQAAVQKARMGAPPKGASACPPGG